MLAPHHAEYAEFGERRLALAEKLFDLFVFLGSKAVLPEGLRRKRGSHGTGHGEALLSHFEGIVGKGGLKVLLAYLTLIETLKSVTSLVSGKISSR